MLKSVLATSGVKSIAIRQERHSAKFLDKISNNLDILRTNECKIPKLTEVHFDSNEFTFKVNIFNSGFNAKFFEFLLKISPNRHSEISKINFRLLHNIPSELYNIHTSILF